MRRPVGFRGGARRGAAALARGGVACVLVGLVLGLGATGASAGDDGDSTAAPDAIARRFERGPVRVEVTLSPSAPVIGDVIELVLEATAEPEVELLMPEFGEALGRFEILDFAPSERLDASGRTVARQRYRLQPRRSGPQSIPPLRVEFVDRRAGHPPAPEGEDAFEILTERLTIEVEPVLAADAPLELEGPHPDLGARAGPLAAGWLLALGALGALAIASPFLWRAYQAAAARRRRRSAYEIARGELDALLAEGRPDAEAMDAFYVRLSTIVRTYLENRFGLRSPELTTQEFLAVMGRSPDLARSHQQMLRDFLEQADLVKFAGHRPDERAVAESIASAERFLEETRDQVTSVSAAPAVAEEGARV